MQKRRTFLSVLVVLVVALSLWTLLRPVPDSHGPELPLAGAGEVESGPTVSVLGDPDRAVLPASPAAPAPGEAGKRVRIEVLDAAEESPVEGARILARDDEQQRLELGVTGEDGILEAAAEVLESHPCLLAGARGYTVARLRYSPGEDPVRILLEPGQTIRGRVVDGWGQPMGEGITVVAFEKGVVWTTPKILDALAGKPMPPSARTGPGGVFEIPGVSPDLEYVLVAGGSGYRSWFMDHPEARGGEEGVEVRIWPLYGAILELVDGSTGATIPVGRLSYGAGGFASAVPSHMGRRVPLDDGLNYLAGVDPGLIQADEGKEQSRFPALALGSVRPEEMGPLEVHVWLPGSEGRKFEVPLRPVTEGIPTHRLTVYPTAPGLGSLQVSFEGVPRDLLQYLARGNTVGAVELWQDTGEDRPVVYRAYLYPDDVRDGLQLEGIPFGTYDLRLDSLPTRRALHKNTLATVTIGSTPARAVVDFSSWGSLLLHTDAQEARTLTEQALWIEFGFLRPGEEMVDEGMDRVVRSPQVFLGIEPGDYLLHTSGYEYKEIGRFSVGPGEVAELHWRR